MGGYRFRLGSFSSHSNRQNNQDSLLGIKNGTKYEIKLAVLGKTSVGKTAIIHRFLYNQFPEKHKETIDEVYLNELELVKGVDTRLTLDILDMGGNNEFPAMQRIGISNSNAFILVYSIDDEESFQEVRRLRDLIYEIKLEKHISKYSNNVTNKQPINDTFNKTPTKIEPKVEPKIPVNQIKKEVDLKIDQRRHSLNQINADLSRRLNHLNDKLNGHLNGLFNVHLNSKPTNGLFNNQLNGQLNNKLNNQINNTQINNQHQNNQIINQITNQQQNNQTKRRHHFHHHKHIDKSKKPYILTNVNQRYKLSENLKLISERRKSLTNSTKISELKSKLDDISENNLNDINQPTADILCLRPMSKLQTSSLPICEQQKSKEQSNKIDIIDEEDNIKYTNKGRRRSSFLLSPSDDSSDESTSCSESECESSNCDDSCCSSKSSSNSMKNLNNNNNINNLKTDFNHKYDKENNKTNNNFEHINLNTYKTKLESLKEQQERLLLNDDMPPFEEPVIVVVGNKSDLESKRVVQAALAENIVQIDWNAGWLETSAKNNYNMTNIFKEMLKQSKLPFVVSNALDSQKNRRRSLPAYPANLTHHLKEPNFKTKRNSCALS